MQFTDLPDRFQSLTFIIDPDATQWACPVDGMIATDFPEHDERLIREAQAVAESWGQESSDVWYFDTLEEFENTLHTIARKIGFANGEELWNSHELFAPADWESKLDFYDL